MDQHPGGLPCKSWGKYSATLSHVAIMYTYSVALFPGLPVFCPSVSFSIIHGSEEREKRRRPGNTYHVNDVWWTRCGRMGGNSALDFIIEHSNNSQDS